MHELAPDLLTAVIACVERAGEMLAAEELKGIRSLHPQVTKLLEAPAPAP